MAAAAQPQEIPLWAKVDIWEEGGSDLEFLLSRSKLIGIEDDGRSKATERALRHVERFKQLLSVFRYLICTLANELFCMGARTRAVHKIVDLLYTLFSFNNNHISLFCLHRLI